MLPRVDKEKRVSNGEVISESNVQLRFDALMCYMIANIIQASANLSRDFLDNFLQRFDTLFSLQEI